MSDEEWIPFPDDDIEIGGHDLWCESDYLAPFWISKEIRVEGILDIMEIKDYDVFYDLGCGDGRILIEAAKRGAKKCVGVEYDVKLAELSLKNVESSGFSHMIEIKIGNFLTLDISDATLIYVFLLPKPVELLKPRFIELMNNANLKMAASVLYELKDWPFRSMYKEEIASYIYFK